MQYAYVPWPGWRALRTKQYMYARTKDKPWFLYDVKADFFEQKNLVDDPSKAALVKEYDDRLASLMKESGDSWDIEATSGDLSAWVPGGVKQQSQNLGVDFPGKAPAAAGAEPAGPRGAPDAPRRCSTDNPRPGPPAATARDSAPHAAPRPADTPPNPRRRRTTSVAGWRAA